MKTHGMTKTRTYKKWAGMKTRCYNEKEESYKYYGAKGIRVCDSWLNSFDNFLKDMGTCPEGYTLDRIDSDNNYSPDNCRWATLKQQANNKTNNRWIEYNGMKKTLSQWSQFRGIGHATILYRLKAKWSIGQALEYEIRENKKPRRWSSMTVHGRKETLDDWAEIIGISKDLLVERLMFLPPHLAVDINIKHNNNEVLHGSQSYCE